MIKIFVEDNVICYECYYHGLVKKDVFECPECGDSLEFQVIKEQEVIVIEY